MSSPRLASAGRGSVGHVKTADLELAALEETAQKRNPPRGVHLLSLPLNSLALLVW